MAERRHPDRDIPHGRIGNDGKASAELRKLLCRRVHEYNGETVYGLRERSQIRIRELQALQEKEESLPEEEQLGGPGEDETH